MLRCAGDLYYGSCPRCSKQFMSRSGLHSHIKKGCLDRRHRSARLVAPRPPTPSPARGSTITSQPEDQQVGGKGTELESCRAIASSISDIMPRGAQEGTSKQVNGPLI